MKGHIYISFFLNKFFFNFFYFGIGVQLINNVVIVSGEGTLSYIYMYPFSPKLPSHSHAIEQSSTSYTVGPCWLSVLNTVVCTCPWRDIFLYWAMTTPFTTKNSRSGTSLESPMVKTLPSSAGDTCLTPDQGTKIPHAAKINKQAKHCKSILLQF